MVDKLCKCGEELGNWAKRVVGDWKGRIGYWKRSMKEARKRIGRCYDEIHIAMERYV